MTNSSLEKALEGWIQRAFFDLKQIWRSSFDVLVQRKAGHRLAFPLSENHRLQGAGKEVTLNRFFHADGVLSCFADLLAQGLE